MTFIEEISTNVYVIYPGSSPRRLPMFRHHRGSAFSLTLIGRNYLNNEPFDFSVVDTFHQHFRMPAKDNEIVVEFDAGNFTLGQTQGAIDFDIAEGNAVGTTKDELHIHDDGEKFNVEDAILFTDTKMKVGVSTLYLVHFLVNTTYNVTRLS